ncbi:MAG: hypothetical protein OXU64_05500 [Gemmatimonadota bacterium]|nr:hypothetical protein [Gemmatimonadota bacterium]
MTPPDMPVFGRVSLIDASAFDAGTAYVSTRLPPLDEFRPHVWSTEDYGETWTRIVDGIRDDAYLNSVREDPNREGLLYAGTNHGVYVTFDDGGWWRELNPGLPDMPVTDVIPQHDELAMASHGRGFRVLDNVGPLRRWEPGSGGVPGTAERAWCCSSLRWRTGQGAGWCCRGGWGRVLEVRRRRSWR